MAFEQTPLTGLTSQQVNKKMAAGEHNTKPVSLTRSPSAIIKSNTLTLFNFVNLALGVLIATTGSYANLLFLFVAIINTAIGTFQELRAKRQLDKMTILAETPAQVMRDGQLTAVPQEKIVLGDLIQLHRGDQIPVDGVVRQTAGAEVDESPLTGEANAIDKHPGDALMSGSFIVAGQLLMQATAVGADTFAAKITDSAKAARHPQSQLLATINRIIQILTYVLIPLGAVYFTVAMIRRGNYNRAILSTAAAMIGMIPEGLVLLTNVALAVSAMNLGRKRVLVSALPAIEALARVDVLCLDKTGTITSGQLRVAGVYPERGETEDTVTQAGTAVTYALNDDNETALAIKQAWPQTPSVTTVSTVPFSSSRKWSGATFADGRSLLMGAPEFIFGASLPQASRDRIKRATQAGFRVLAVASTDHGLTAPLQAVQLLGFITIADEVRPAAAETLAFFGTQDVTLKVISGDNPLTVANVAQQAALPHADQAIDMSTVADDADFNALAERYTVFGRVTPPQKKQLIAALQQNGHTVAMTGDGVNDVPALRQSDCAIAMASGAEAAKSIADFTLLDSNFDAMTGVLNEGRRVINNIERVASMYLIKTIFSVILTAIFVFLPLDYPITPINLTPVSAICVAIPSFFLTLEPNFTRVTGRFLQKVMTIAAPAALAIVIYTLLLTRFEYVFNWSFALTSTLVVFMIGVIEYHVVLLVARPFNRYKAAMVLLVAIMFFLTFFVVNRVFALANLWDWGRALFYLPLLASSVPVYLLLQEFLGRRILSKINWRF
ncbi:cation-translocating P-type ATPase [Lacticaseibacillus hegangensis]|uniref:Cation-translocating P-type ATPase n=1 Tax=Lacticaseibacillus hegangensis TaxID=2486010 RepID=A0ABW4CVB9_9LACO|nr:cation-translocating P-type ATPase [Lacticaseibacillus hegangensis]